MKRLIPQERLRALVSVLKTRSGVEQAEGYGIVCGFMGEERWGSCYRLPWRMYSLESTRKKGLTRTWLHVTKHERRDILAHRAP